MKDMNPFIRCKPWRSVEAPKKILAIRFQAMGDLVITLPYLQSLKNSVPDARLHLLTRSEVSDIPKNLTLFDKVIQVGGGRHARLQFIMTVLLLPYLWWQRYEIVLDLQNHKISRMVRHMLFPSSWSEFDRSSRSSAGERTKSTIQAINVGTIYMDPTFPARREIDFSKVLTENGWNGNSDFVVLNPAGAFVTRNWPLQNYVAFAEQWLEKIDAKTFFVVIGLKSLSPKAASFRKHLKEKIIDLTGKTTPSEAFMIIRNAKFVLTEDSGLMHMAWVQGVPTLALFGSSPSYWSAPLGVWSRCLSSSDLPCGNCFSATCHFGDVRCLTRYTPEYVLEEARNLILLKNGF